METCAVEWCDRPVDSKGWCSTHYYRHRTGRDMDAPIRGYAPRGTWVGKGCAFVGCCAPVDAKGWCWTHYKRVSKHDDPFAGASQAQSAGSPTVVYIVRHPHLGSGKVGIGDPDGRRVRDHTVRGWVVVWVSETMPRSEARSLERRLLSLLPALGFLGPADMPQRGWTETFDARWIDAVYRQAPGLAA